MKNDIWNRNQLRKHLNPIHSNNGFNSYLPNIWNLLLRIGIKINISAKNCWKCCSNATKKQKANKSFLINWKESTPRPVRISFRKFGKSFKSTIEVTAPSKVPNWESIPLNRIKQLLKKVSHFLKSLDNHLIPKVNSIKKKRIDQNGAIPGNWLMASVNTINAKPVPEAPYRQKWRFEGIFSNNKKKFNK